MKISELCRKAETIKESDSLRMAGKIMREKHADFIIVLSDDSKPVGIVTAYEILEKESKGENFEKIKAKEAMFSNILLLEENEEKEEVIKAMLAHKHWLAVVVDKDKKFKGIITSGELL